MDHGIRSRHGSRERVCVASLIGLSTRLARTGSLESEAVDRLRAAAHIDGSFRDDLLAQARGWHEAMAERGQPEHEASPRAAALLAAAGGTDPETTAVAKTAVEATFQQRHHSAPTHTQTTPWKG